MLNLRAWDPVAKHMSYGKVEYFDDSVMIRFDHFECEPEEVIYMRPTGLKDKNGKEIYEGDIITSFKKQYEHTPTTNKVQFVRGCWRLVAGSMNDVPLYNYEECELEVIGNIHEHPHLLDGEE
jgi:uncharacterized phage protein (TIGR01671 family)